LPRAARTRFARVLADDRAHRVLCERDLARSQTVREQLLGDQESLSDLDLLRLRVAGEVQHLHAVAQRGRNRLQRVGRGDEHDLREVEGNIQVVVAEILVLLRVEHLEQRG